MYISSCTFEDHKAYLQEKKICARCCVLDDHCYADCILPIKCDACYSNRHPTAVDQQVLRMRGPHHSLDIRLGVPNVCQEFQLEQASQENKPQKHVTIRSHLLACSQNVKTCMKQTQRYIYTHAYIALFHTDVVSCILAPNYQSNQPHLLLEVFLVLFNSLLLFKYYYLYLMSMYTFSISH